MTADGGPELIQLLTPEGERVHHPEYDVDLTPDELRALAAVLDEIDAARGGNARLDRFGARLREEAARVQELIV